MAIITLIAALDQRSGIGKDNRLLCHMRADMLRFKALTTGHTVIMGRNTFESLPKGALPDRRNIVVSSNALYVAANCEMARTIDSAFAMLGEREDAFVIGGGSLYRQTIDRADRLEITRIEAELDADTFFPPISPERWEEEASRSFPADERNPYAYRFVTYRRRGGA